MKAKLVSNGLEFDITKAQFLFCVAKMIAKDTDLVPDKTLSMKKKVQHGTKRRYTAKDDLLMIGMAKQKRPIKKIAEAVHRTRNSVWCRLSYLRKTGRLK